MHFYTPWTNNVSLVYMLANDMHTPPILDHNSYRLSIIFEFWLHISCPYSSGSIVTLGQKTEQKWFHMTCKSCCCPHNKNGKEKKNELWQKHAEDLMSVQMWVMENPNSIFYYVMPQWIWTCQTKMIPHSHLASKPFGKQKWWQSLDTRVQFLLM